MGYKVRLTESARKDLRGIGDYIYFDLKEPETSREIVQGILDSAEALRETPARHEFIDNKVLAKLGVRKQYYKYYVVFYRIMETALEVQIFAILHMRVDAKAVLIKRLK